jgi:hypothetical protein
LAQGGASWAAAVRNELAEAACVGVARVEQSYAEERARGSRWQRVRSEHGQLGGRR